jgi:hypothetical protein
VVVGSPGGRAQEREGREGGQGAEQAGHDIRGAQAGRVGDEAAGQRASRHQAPAEHAVDAVDAAQQVRGDDALAEADRHDVPHGDGKALDGQQPGRYGRVRREPDPDERGGVDHRREDERGQQAQPAAQDRVDQPADHAADGGRGEQQAVAAGADVQHLGGQQHQDGLAHLVGEVVDAEQHGDHAEQAVPGQPAQSLGDLGPDPGAG